jgi:glycosyltransferase involved in cell wall biosynthesis
VPVIASDVPGHRALIDDGNTRMFFRPDDSSQLAAAILAIIDSPDWRKAMVARAREHFCARRLAEEYIALYETL